MKQLSAEKTNSVTTFKILEGSFLKYLKGQFEYIVIEYMQYIDHLYYLYELVSCSISIEKYH